MHQVLFEDLGIIGYKEAWEYQESLLADIISKKRENRTRNESEKIPIQSRLLFVEHPPVYTLGKSGFPGNLLIEEKELKSIGAEYYPINRGGDITFHGFGQLVAYPVFDLEFFFTDIHKYLRYLEQIVIDVLKEYGVNGERSKNKGETGVWIDAETPFTRKICSMGVRASRWVTMHGLAFNVNTDLKFFEYIIPCGIQGKGVTSLKKELNKSVNLETVKEKMKEKFQNQFSIQLQPTSVKSTLK